MNNPCQNSGSFEHRSSLLLYGAPQPRCKTRSVGAVCTPRSPAVLQVLHLRAPSSGASGCNTASYEFISLVGHEELRNNFTLSPWPCFSAESIQFDRFCVASLQVYRDTTNTSPILSAIEWCWSIFEKIRWEVDVLDRTCHRCDSQQQSFPRPVARSSSDDGLWAPLSITRIQKPSRSPRLNLTGEPRQFDDKTQLLADVLPAIYSLPWAWTSWRPCVARFRTDFYFFLTLVGWPWAIYCSICILLKSLAEKENWGCQTTQ